ncbi:unnamed protein product [Vicia faba]|uniref:Uncharacterized protein n=1 Tax=Vicia faba TaxID=3906 RepID=A0AAV0ZD59_VICFA|nr:unnamed protein product [Vicia faba]
MAKAKRHAGRSNSTAESQGMTDETVIITTIEEDENPAEEKHDEIHREENEKLELKVQIQSSVMKKEEAEKPWVKVIQGNCNLNCGMIVEFIAPTIINGEIKIVINESDVAEELEFWENVVI